MTHLELASKFHRLTAAAGRRSLAAWVLCCLALAAVPAMGQEIIVAASRSRSSVDEGEAAPIPAVVFRQRADHVVQRLLVVDDTRDAEARLGELKAAIVQLEEASRGSRTVQIALVVETADGPVLVRPFDRERAMAAIDNGPRPDTSQVQLLAKTAIAEADRDRSQPVARIEAFLRGVRLEGRAQVEAIGEPALSIVKPEQYRGQVMAAIAADVRSITDQFGQGYGGRIEGLERPVEWIQVDELELALFVPYRLTVTH